jgi:hypothetical protein
MTSIFQRLDYCREPALVVAAERVPIECRGIPNAGEKHGGVVQVPTPISLVHHEGGAFCYERAKFIRNSNDDLATSSENEAVRISAPDRLLTRRCSERVPSGEAGSQTRRQVVCHHEIDLPAIRVEKAIRVPASAK